MAPAIVLNINNNKKNAIMLIVMIYPHGFNNIQRQESVTVTKGLLLLLYALCRHQAPKLWAGTALSLVAWFMFSNVTFFLNKS